MNCSTARSGKPETLGRLLAEAEPRRFLLATPSDDGEDADAAANVWLSQELRRTGFGVTCVEHTARRATVSMAWSLSRTSLHPLRVTLTIGPARNVSRFGRGDINGLSATVETSEAVAICSSLLALGDESIGTNAPTGAA